MKKVMNGTMIIIVRIETILERIVDTVPNMSESCEVIKNSILLVKSPDLRKGI